jgi:hypothetical protein
LRPFAGFDPSKHVQAGRNRSSCRFLQIRDHPLFPQFDKLAGLFIRWRFLKGGGNGVVGEQRIHGLAQGRWK